MIKADKNALICDLAETYHIYDYNQMPPSQVAIFAIGLRNDSRIKLKMTGAKFPIDTLLLSAITDAVRLLLWSKTKDGSKGINQPKSILSGLYQRDSEKVTSYSSGKDFEMARKRLLEGG